MHSDKRKRTTKKEPAKEDKSAHQKRALLRELREEEPDFEERIPWMEQDDGLDNTPIMDT